uniref:Ig-like domain-containing protein n=1 Tax=Oreochromis niloticus TaxID=8128 RepID=A0A669CVQ9_ORENI
MYFSRLADTYVTATCGQDVVLRCQNTTASPITLVEWQKSTVSSCYVYFFQDQCSYDNYQCNMFTGRVQLLDPSMRNGNCAVILRNVSVADTGLYTCEVSTRNTTIDHTRVVAKGHVNLTVTEYTKAPSSHSPQPRGRLGVIAALILLLTFIVVLCGVVWIRANQKHKTPEGETCSNV